MRRTLAALLLLPLLAGPLWAELRIVGELKVKRDRTVRLAAEGAADKAALIWDVSDEERADAEEWGNKFRFSAPPGTYRVKVRAVSLSKDGATTIETARATVTVEGAPDPVPPGPTPPGPNPPPVPPDPAAPLRVLVVYETADLPKMPAAQRALLFDAKVRAALKDRTDKAGPDQRGWNIWDKDTDVSQTAPFWQSAMKRPRAAVPFVHLFKGDKPVYEGPLPADAAAMLDLINKHGG
jgi:hypothetical protein